ncbi:MAG: restriction endonuclease subunit S [Sulfurimonas sp.]
MGVTCKVPELRFKEFSGEWEENKLGDIATFLKGKGISKSDIINDGTLECIRYGELYTRYNEVIINVKSRTNLDRNDLMLSKYNDVIIPASGETQIDIATASCILKDNIALSGDLNIIRSKINGVFLSYYLNNKKKIDIAKLSQGISVVHLYSSQLKSLHLNLPSKPEQEKIASFLSAVDSRIEQLTKKEQLLREYKKGVMQKIFSQELRFKDDDGSEFPEWENSIIENHFDVASSKRVLQKDWINKGIPFYRTRELVSLANNTSFSSEIFISEKLFKELSDKYGIPKEGDYLVSGVGTLGIYYQVKSTDKFYFKDGNVLWLKRKSTIDSNFFKYCFESDFIQSQIVAQASTTTVGTYTIQNAKKTKLFLPKNIKEQTKIANFLSSLDTKIEQVSKELKLTKEFKKALLQKMFV